MAKLYSLFHYNTALSHQYANLYSKSVYDKNHLPERERTERDGGKGWIPH